MSECYTARPLTFVFQDRVTVSCSNTFLSSVIRLDEIAPCFVHRNTRGMSALSCDPVVVEQAQRITATCSLPSSDVIIEPVPTYGITRDVMLVDVVQTLECSENGSSATARTARRVRSR